MAIRKSSDSGLASAIKSSLSAYRSGSRQFFEFCAPNVRVFALNDSATPVVGREAFIKSFGRSLAAQKRNVAVLNGDVQVRGSQAVQSQTLQIAAKGVTSHVRQTVVWERDNAGDWKMTHIHNALVGTPIVDSKLLKGADPVRVLNERIATVAATVGMAQ